MKILLIIIILIIIYFIYNKLNKKYDLDSINTKFDLNYIDKHYDCIISINVHEKFNFLIKQLDNINKNVSLSYAVILNCNDYMFNECKNNKLPNNVYINPIILNKRRFHGSLLNGIYNNMTFALSNFKFKYFIVASSRNMFGNNMKLDDLDRINNIKIEQNNDYIGWHWPNFLNTLLAKYYLGMNKKLYKSAHEGLVFNKKCCQKIVDFLENNSEIKNDLFNYEGCVEEFAFQTIAINIDQSFFDIGNGIEVKMIDINNNNQFMYKVLRY